MYITIKTMFNRGNKTRLYIVCLGDNWQPIPIYVDGVPCIKSTSDIPYELIEIGKKHHDKTGSKLGTGGGFKDYDLRYLEAGKDKERDSISLGKIEITSSGQTFFPDGIVDCERFDNERDHGHASGNPEATQY